MSQIMKAIDLKGNYTEKQHFKHLKEVLKNLNSDQLFKLERRLAKKLLSYFQVWKTKFYIDQRKDYINKLRCKLQKFQKSQRKFLFFKFALKVYDKIFQNKPQQMKGLKKINLDKKREIEEKTLKITQNELTLEKQLCFGCITNYKSSQLQKFRDQKILLLKYNDLKGNSQNENYLMKIQNQLKISQAICALKNTLKGGYILLGSVKNQKYIEGKIVNDETKEQIINSFNNSLKRIFPKDSNGDTNVDLSFIDCEQKRKIIRISVYPSQQMHKNVYYVKDRSNNSALHEFFQLRKENGKPQILRREGEQIYEFIERIHKQKSKHIDKSLYSKHYNSKCQRVEHIKTDISEGEFEFKKKKELNFEGQFQFPFKFNSFLVLRSEKQFLLNNMREQLDFYFSKYLLTKIKGVSSFEDIWVLSHDDDHGFMKNILKKIDRLEHMKFIEIRRYLAVKNIKVNQAKKTVEQVCDKLKERCKKMRKNYQNISYEYIKQEKKLQMNFKTLSEAAFVYLYLKKKELETYFIKNKENQINL